MDPISASSLSDMRQADLANQVSMAVVKKSMDAAKQQGQAAIELLQAAAEMAKGEQSASDGRIDLLA